MGHRELLTALRRKGEEKARELRSGCAEEEEKLRAAAAERLLLLKGEADERRTAACAEHRRKILAEAGHEASLVRQRAEHDLALRLERLARECLPRLRDARYPALLARMANELPPGEWGEVRVNPMDRELATPLFQGARITPAPEICGGLEAISMDGGLTVMSTLESRLEKGWDDLLPLLMAAVREDGP
mgnify:CR=1 FL=1